MAASGVGCGVYRSQDSLKNFKIRVKIEKCLSEYPTTPIIGKRNSLECQEFSCLDSLRTSKLEIVEDRTFTWQEKIFSDSEIEKYTNKASCISPLEKKYSDLLQNSGPSVRCGKCLFTYVNEDEPVYNNRSVTKPDDFSTKLSQNISELRNRRSGKIVAESAWETENLPKKNIVTDKNEKFRHCMLSPVKTMRIMAVIKNEESEVTENNETVIATITVNNKGVIIVTPDFNAGKTPYLLEIKSEKESYYYTLEHASNRISTDENEQISKLQITSKPLFNPLSASHEFTTADPNLMHLFIFGEIVSAEKFEYDGLSVNFFLDLPQGWIMDENSLLYHVTQRCETGNSDKPAYFSYPFEYEIACPKHVQTESTDNLPKWPTLCLQVTSKDSWQRFRTEGYGYINIPFTPGSYSFVVTTWRPTVPSLISQLKRFFIGGSPELMNLSQVAVPSTLQSNYLSRYGMRSESSGIVHIRLHVVKQCMTPLLDLEHEYSTKTSASRLSSLQKDVAKVIEAFHRARHRMLAARENAHL